MRLRGEGVQDTQENASIYRCWSVSLYFLYKIHSIKSKVKWQNKFMIVSRGPARELKKDAHKDFHETQKASPMIAYSETSMAPSM